MLFLWQTFQTVLGLIFRHPLFGVIIIPIQEDGRIILIRRRDSQRWGLPGGMVEWGEDLASALRRELWEETGLEVQSMGRLVGIYSSPCRDPRLHSICAAVEVKVVGQVAIADHREVMDVQAFKPEQIPCAELAHDHIQQLTDYWQGKTVVA